MTREEAIDLLDNLIGAVEDNHGSDYDGALKMGIQALKQQQSSKDCISRQAVLNLIEHYNSDGLGSVFYGYEEGVKFADAVNKLPSVTPKTDMLDKIRTEIEQTAKDYDKFDDYRRVRGLWIALEIIDKYAKSEENE